MELVAIQKNMIIAHNTLSSKLTALIMSVREKIQNAIAVKQIVMGVAPGDDFLFQTTTPITRTRIPMMAKGICWVAKLNAINSNMVSFKIPKNSKVLYLQYDCSL